MKTYSLFLILLATYSLSGFGANRPGRSEITQAKMAPSTTILSVGPALEIPGEGKALPGFSFSAATPVSSTVPLYVGADAGFYLDTADKFKGNIPVMAVMYLEFATGGRVHPLLGVSAGPVFGVGEGQKSVQFGMLLKPGLNISLSNDIDLNIESRLGVYGSTFVYLPQIAASFTI